MSSSQASESKVNLLNLRKYIHREIAITSAFPLILPPSLSHLLFPAASSLPVDVMRTEQSDPQQTAATLTPSCPTEIEGGRDNLCGTGKLSCPPKPS